MPEPRQNETRKDFIARCMSDDESLSDFPDNDQRFAFCQSQYLRKSEEHIGDQLQKESIDNTITNMSTDIFEKFSSGESSVDKEHGLAFGFAFTCSDQSGNHIDTQNDHIVVSGMIESCIDFVEKSERPLKEMHTGERRGSVTFVMPITKAIRKFISENEFEGMFVGVMPDEQLMAKIKDGTFGGFSIGGRVLDAEEVQTD